jgi:hypothetical protein
MLLVNTARRPTDGGERREHFSRRPGLSCPKPALENSSDLHCSRRRAALALFTWWWTTRHDAASGNICSRGSRWSFTSSSPTTIQPSCWLGCTRGPNDALQPTCGARLRRVGELRRRRMRLNFGVRPYRSCGHMNEAYPTMNQRWQAHQSAGHSSFFHLNHYFDASSHRELGCRQLRISRSGVSAGSRVVAAPQHYAPTGSRDVRCDPRSCTYDHWRSTPEFGSGRLRAVNHRVPCSSYGSEQRAPASGLLTGLPKPCNSY